MPNEWIDVHDKLPEPYEEVLICRYNSELKYNSIGLDQLIKVYSKVFWEDFSEHYKESVWRITHWMPIPPPPKERILEISKEDVPSADVVEVVHSKWILYTDGSGECERCHTRQKNVWDFENWQNFCGHCGADMRGEKDG